MYSQHSLALEGSGRSNDSDISFLCIDYPMLIGVCLQRQLDENSCIYIAIGFIFLIPGTPKIEQIAEGDRVS